MLSLIRVSAGTISLILFGGQVIHATKSEINYFTITFLITVLICYVLLFLARFYDAFSGAGIRKLQISLVIFSVAYIINELLQHHLPLTVGDWVQALIKLGYIILPEVIFEVLWELKNEASVPDK